MLQVHTDERIRRALRYQVRDFAPPTPGDICLFRRDTQTTKKEDRKWFAGRLIGFDGPRVAIIRCAGQIYQPSITDIRAIPERVDLMKLKGLEDLQGAWRH